MSNLNIEMPCTINFSFNFEEFIEYFNINENEFVEALKNNDDFKLRDKVICNHLSDIMMASEYQELIDIGHIKDVHIILDNEILDKNYE